MISGPGMAPDAASEINRGDTRVRGPTRCGAVVHGWMAPSRRADRLYEWKSLKMEGGWYWLIGRCVTAGAKKESVRDENR